MVRLPTPARVTIRCDRALARSSWSDRLRRHARHADEACDMSQHRMKRKRMDRGSVMVIAALAMTALLLFAALTIDVGMIWASRTQSQNVNDSVALAAA